jgi:5'-nucleotidase (lipoprotein e(P4) family)
VNRFQALTGLAASSLVLSGCAAVAVVPLAGGMLVKKTVVDPKTKRSKAKRGKATSDASAASNGQVTLTNLRALPAPNGSTPAAPATSAAAEVGKVPVGMQYLYGSGEAAALSYQAYLGLIDQIIAKSSDRTVGQKVSSVVMTADSTLAAPRFVECGTKPLAVVFDVDETALLNLGYEADDAGRGGAYDAKRWERWEKTGAGAVVATPGMIEVARVAKVSNVTLVFNTNRTAANAADTEEALTGAGLGPVKHLSNLWLQGDLGDSSAKDSRRQAIAAKFCVIAMAGDQLGDFSDLFNAPGLDPRQRRALPQGTYIKTLWGHGWYILPNPVYGTGLKGNLDQVFPADKRWTDPGEPPAAAPLPEPPAPAAKQ